MAAIEDIQISDVIGSKGRYQTLTGFTLFMMSAVTGAQLVYVQFLAPGVELHWDWDTSSASRTIFDSNNCKLQDIRNFNLTSENSTETSKLIYESDSSKNTITEQFGLVCEYSWLISFTKSLSAICVVVGNPILGPFTEKHGRKKISHLLIFLAVVSNMCMLFAQNYEMFAISYFLAAGSTFYLVVIFSVQYTEIIPLSSRPLVGSLLQAGFLFGMCLIPGAGWILKDWFFTQLAQVVFTCLQVPLIWYMLESPTWLMVKEKHVEAKENLMKIAQRNNIDCDKTEVNASLWLEKMKEARDKIDKNDMGKITDLFRNREIAKYTLCLIGVASAAQFCYHGIVMNVESFGSGLYEDYFISNAFTLISLIAVALSTKWISVKRAQIICLTICSIVCALYTLLYEYLVGRMIITALGRAIAAPVINIFIGYAAEVFPTSVRIVGSTFVQSMSRIVVSAGPFTKELGERTRVYIPFILFSAFSFAGAALLCLLPETKDRPLVHNVQDLKRKRSENTNL